MNAKTPPLLAIAAASGASAFLGWMLASGMPMPVIHADEGSYLLNAFALAGRFAVRLAGEYYAGYSALLVPFASGDAATLHRGALGVNVALVALLPLLYFLMIRAAFPRLSRWNAVAIATFAAFLPSHLYYTQLVFSDNLLVSAYAASLVVLAHALRGGRWSPLLAGLAGLLLAWCFLANPRGLVTGAAVVGTTLLVSLRYPATRPVSIAFAASWVLGCMAHGPLEQLAGGPAMVKHGYSIAGALARLLDPQNLYNVTRAAAGVYAYAALAGAGLAGVAFAVAFRQIWSLRAPTPACRPDAAIVLVPSTALVLFATMLMTAAFFAEPSRADHVIYGRYVAGTLGPVLGLGFAALVADRSRWRVLAGFSAVAIAVVALLAWSYVAKPPPEYLAPINVVEAYPYLRGSPGIDWLGLGVGIAAVSGGFLLLFRISPILAGVGGATYFAAVAIWSAHTFLQPQALRQSAQAEFFSRVEAIAARGDRPLCIATGQGVDAWHLIAYRVFLWQHLLDESFCEKAVLESAGHAAPLFEQGYRGVAMDLRRPVLLLLPAGQRLDSMDDSLQIGPWALEELDAGARAARVDLVSPLPAEIPARLPFRFDVRVRNLSDRVLLHYTRYAPLKAAVRIGAKLIPEDSAGTAVELRADLHQPLAPGAVQTATLTIPEGIATGSYVLKIGMVNEGVAWFGCADQGQCQFPIRISGDAEDPARTVPSPERS